ncbi:hypothetical protein LCGC14_1085050 [marine sediment metagenome]|uniref:Uncharacterized protein n=1 Tax=marine sediment metagenome TaxID=412755 RepID=A0A0F9N1N8_9ZZZZ
MSRFTKGQVEAAEKDLVQWEKIKAAETVEEGRQLWRKQCHTCQGHSTCYSCTVYIARGETCRVQGWLPLLNWFGKATEENRATMQKGVDWIIAICNEVIAEGYNDEL